MHISELQQGRVGKTCDVVNVGDAVKVKVIGFDERGKVKLSMRVVDQATGADITEQVGAKPGRGDREPDRERRPDEASATGGAIGVEADVRLAGVATATADSDGSQAATAAVGGRA